MTHHHIISPFTIISFSPSFTIIPFLPFQLSGLGDLEGVRRLYKLDPTRLTLQDTRGQTLVHSAAARGRNHILRFILEEHGGIH